MAFWGLVYPMLSNPGSQGSPGTVPSRSPETSWTGETHFRPPPPWQRTCWPPLEPWRCSFCNGFSYFQTNCWPVNNWRIKVCLHNRIRAHLRHCNTTFLGKFFLGLLWRIGVGQVRVEIFIQNFWRLFAKVSSLSSGIKESRSENHYCLAGTLLQLNLKAVILGIEMFVIHSFQSTCIELNFLWMMLTILSISLGVMGLVLDCSLSKFITWVVNSLQPWEWEYFNAIEHSGWPSVTWSYFSSSQW